MADLLSRTSGKSGQLILHVHRVLFLVWRLFFFQLISSHTSVAQMVTVAFLKKDETNHACSVGPGCRVIRNGRCCLSYPKSLRPHILATISSCCALCCGYSRGHVVHRPLSDGLAEPCRKIPANGCVAGSATRGVSVSDSGLKFCGRETPRQWEKVSRCHCKQG